eukprot:7754819-Pyramimonas_sp.AAC.1
MVQDGPRWFSPRKNAHVRAMPRGYKPLNAPSDPSETAHQPAGPSRRVKTAVEGLGWPELARNGTAKPQSDPKMAQEIAREPKLAPRRAPRRAQHRRIRFGCRMPHAFLTTYQTTPTQPEDPNF